MKFLVMQQKMIGDVLTSSIICAEIKRQNPHNEVHFLAHQHTLPVLENNPNINRIIAIKSEDRKNIFSLRRFVKKNLTETYDVVIDAYGKFESNLVCLWVKAEQKISFHKAYTAWIYTHTYQRYATPKTQHGIGIEHRLMLLQPVFESINYNIYPKIYLNTAEIQWAKQQIANHIHEARPCLMIGALGSSDNKTYPLPYLAKLLNAITEDSSAALLLNYIPSQRPAVDQLMALCNEHTRGRIFEDIYGKSLREFMALCSVCKAYIGNEGGAGNMAKALEVPTFSIFSPQIPKSGWDIKEDHQKHFSVHLSDFEPDFLAGKSTKELKSTLNNTAYQRFKPELFQDQLLDFVGRHLA
ncbi:MAG: glycosyltransferase family 9 protein [Flavobacteriaceae bacterium]|nr:glycosyltransferase family 9 protein [Flavobacteriaceae bacterium]